MIGRTDDVAGVIDRLDAASLVTIVGPGGVGKTTLALAVAHHLQVGFADGVVFVDLAQVPPGADLTRALAEAAGVQGMAGGKPSTWRRRASVSARWRLRRCRR